MKTCDGGNKVGMQICLGSGARVGVGMFRGRGGSSILDFWLLDVKVPWFPSFLSSWFPSFLVSKSLDFKVSWCQNFRLSEIPNCPSMLFCKY